MAEQDWKADRKVFWAVSSLPLGWTLLFFLVPMSFVWLYSFGSNVGLTDIEISGTLAPRTRVRAGEESRKVQPLDVDDRAGRK